MKDEAIRKSMIRLLSALQGLLQPSLAHPSSLILHPSFLHWFDSQSILT
jgi:hypothetical protein